MNEQELYAQYLKETGATQAPASQPSDQELYQQYLAEQKQGDQVVNEMPEGLQGRFTYKNFGADPVASFAYLEKQNPDFELKKDKDGEVLARKRGTQTWGRLDPKGFDWRDLTDVAYDVPAALAQGAATAASGLAGGAVSGGVGAIPAAMAGGAGSGAALEGVRQTIGKAMGIEDNYSGRDLGIAAGIGAASPLLLGTGASAAGAMAKSAGSEAAAKELLASQRGLLGRGYDAAAGYVGPKLGSFVSGENPEVIKTAAGMLEKIKAADKNPEISTAPLSEAATAVNKTLKQKATEAGKRMEELRAQIDNQPGLVLAGDGATQAKGTIPAAEFIQPFQDLAEKISKGGANTEAQKADAEALKRVIESEFKGLPENLTSEQVANLRNRFKTRAEQYGMSYGSAKSATGGSSGSAIDKQIASAFEESRKAMTDSIVNRLEQISPEMASEYRGLNDTYSKLKTLQTDVNAKTKNSKSMSNFLTQATKNPHDEKLMLDVVEATGLDLPKVAYEEQALKTFSKPSTAVRSIGGSTSTSRTIPLSTAGGAAGYYLGQKYGWSPFLSSSIMGTLGATAGSPAAMRKYMQLNSVLRETVPTQMPGFSALPYLMMNPEAHDQGEK